MSENYAIEVGVATVSELIEILQSLPERYRSWPVCCGGTDLFLCVNEAAQYIVLDTEDLFEEYDDDEWLEDVM